MKFGSKVLAGAVALALGGTAMANTTLSTTDAGDLFFNFTSYVLNGLGGTSATTSFLFDTGIKETSFNQDSTYSFNLSTNTSSVGTIATSANLSSFLSGLPSGAILGYSVLGTVVTNPGLNATYNDYFTANTSVPTNDVTKPNARNASSTEGNFLAAADGTSTGATASSVYLPNASWGAALTEGNVSNNLVSVSSAPYGDTAAVGTALDFYSELGTTLTSYTAGEWLLSQNTQGQYVLSWGPASSPVPLPAPLLLLLSGIGGMALIARRRGRTGVSASGLTAA